MTYSKIYFHLVWTTKQRYPFLDTIEKRKIVWEHIRAYAKSKNIDVLIEGGYKDHCHCLVSLQALASVSKTIQLIKGESSHWINKNRICREKFQWQSDYFASHFSEKDISTIYAYIERQEVHHKEKSFEDELEELREKIATIMDSDKSE